ncbi:MAG: hypothetical protein KatS3mg105_3045 [Gemmatales bacterium]|nr:MAG: hypothetical protein KatS3mg105_3045 [Gemmatales bacterium]
MSIARDRLQQSGWFVFWATLFAIVHTQAPLYYSNQNQYFLHGLAQAGAGHLDQDWLANTKDPTPIFSFLVKLTARYLHENLFYLYYAIIFGIYVASLNGIFSKLTHQANSLHPDVPDLTRLVFFTSLLLVHAAVLRWACSKAAGHDYLWYLQAGLAGQYLLGPMYQPSVHGVLLLLSVWVFLNDRPFLAVIVSSGCAVIHTTYMLSAALLTVSYLWLLLRERRIKTAFCTGFLALAIVLPIVIWNLATFGPESAESFERATRILAHFRIPHHAVVDYWFSRYSACQLMWLATALCLAYGQRLFSILVIVAAGSLILSLVQVMTGNNTLALLFPWRPSAFLMPICTTIILTRGIVAWKPQLLAKPRIVRGLAWTLIALALAGGAVVSWFGLNIRKDEREQAVLSFVRANSQRGDCYLVPFHLPRPQREAIETGQDDFGRLPRLAQKDRRIPVDFQRFRLHARTPIHVDFKSIPYKDVEVIEWFTRLKWAHFFYKQLRSGYDPAMLDELQQRRITHVIVEADYPPFPDDFKVLYEDAAYRVVELPPRTAVVKAEN